MDSPLCCWLLLRLLVFDSMMKIFLVGDSTCQSYGPDMAPQQGWGGAFYKYFQGSASAKIEEITHEKPKAMSYVLPQVTIENWGASARSSRTYIEEGRLDMLRKRIQKGDYVLIQFAHNDAKEDMPEKYVSVKDYPGWLDVYRQTVLEREGTPVFLSSIAKRNAEEFPDRKVHYSFMEYREAMMDFCRKTHSAFVDFGMATADYCNLIGVEASKSLYLHVEPGLYKGSMHSTGKKDDIHLNENGAFIYAGILVHLLERDPVFARFIPS